MTMFIIGYLLGLIIGLGAGFLFGYDFRNKYKVKKLNDVSHAEDRK